MSVVNLTKTGETEYLIMNGTYNDIRMKIMKKIFEKRLKQKFEKIFEKKFRKKVDKNSFSEKF